MSNTGSQNAVTHKYRPEWRLGQIGDIIRKRYEQENDTEEDIQKLIQYTEADLDYAQKIFSVIELTLKEVRENGLNKELALAVESVNPNSIPANVINCMTSNYSDSFRKETVLALEVSRNNLIFVVILAVVGLILKIINWILRNRSTSSTAYTSSNNALNGFTEQTNTAAKEVKVPFVETIKTTIVKSGFVDHVKNIDDNKLADFELFCAKLDTFVSETGADDFLSTLSGFNKDTNILDGIFKKFIEDKSYKFEQILDGVILSVVRTGITNFFFDTNTANTCFDKMPAICRNNGIKILSKGLIDNMDKNNAILAHDLDIYLKATIGLFDSRDISTIDPYYNENETIALCDTFMEAITKIHSDINAMSPNSQVKLLQGVSSSSQHSNGGLNSLVNMAISLTLPDYKADFPGLKYYDVPQLGGIGFEWFPGPDAMLDTLITFFSSKATFSLSTTTELLEEMNETDKMNMLSALSLLNPDKIVKVSTPSSIDMLKREMAVIERNMKGMMNRYDEKQYRLLSKETYKNFHHIDKYLTDKATGTIHPNNRSAGWINAMYLGDKPLGFLGGCKIVLDIYRGFIQSEGEVNKVINRSNETVFTKK